VSAISVICITSEIPKVKKCVKFSNNNNQSTRREYAKKFSLPAFLQMMLCLSLLNHASAANSEIIPVGTDLAKLIGPINLCSTTRPHDATYIDMEPIDDCTVVDPRQAGVGKLHITPYFPKHFSDSFDIYSCSSEQSTVETFFSFFGGKSVNGRWTLFQPFPESNVDSTLIK
jgi:hypothetical protein